MSVIDQWYNMSPQERKEHYETRKAKINEILETLKKNKEEYKQEQKDKVEKLKDTQKQEKMKKNRTSFNCDLVLRKDFRISPKSKKYFSGEKEIFLDQQGEPVKESYEKDSLIIPNRVLYQKKKIVLTDPKFNLEQSKLVLQQIESNLRHNRNNSYQLQDSGAVYNDYNQVQQNERFLPQINPPQQNKFQLTRHAESSAPFSRQNQLFPEQINYVQQHQFQRKNDGQKYYSPQQKQSQYIQDNIIDRNFSQKDIKSNKFFNQNNQKYNENNFSNNDLSQNQNSNNNYFMPSQNLNKVISQNYGITNKRLNYQREQLPNQQNYHLKQQPPHYANQNYSNIYQSISQPKIQNNYSVPQYNYYQNQHF